MRSFLIVALAVVLSVTAVSFLPKEGTSSIHIGNDPVMARVEKTQTIRCGYVSYSPASTLNQNTKKVEGYNVDIVEEAAKRMGLKVEWGYETNWPTMAADLQSGKFDVGCVTYWNNPRSARQMLTSIPILYQPVFFAARADDGRFDDDIKTINDAGVTVAVLEGDVPETVLNELYPQAKRDVLSPASSFAQVFQEVADGKADVTITSKPDMYEFQQHNPDVLKTIDNQPVRLYPMGVQLPSGANQLKNAFDVTIREMQLDGTIEKIMTGYAKSPDDYYFVENPYTKVAPR